MFFVLANFFNVSEATFPKKSLINFQTQPIKLHEIYFLLHTSITKRLYVHSCVLFHLVMHFKSLFYIDFFHSIPATGVFSFFIALSIKKNDKREQFSAFESENCCLANEKN